MGARYRGRRFPGRFPERVNAGCRRCGTLRASRWYLCVNGVFCGVCWDTRKESYAKTQRREGAEG